MFITALPGWIITCTSTGTASMPWKATVFTLATMPLSPCQRQGPGAACPNLRANPYANATIAGFLFP